MFDQKNSLIVDQSKARELGESIYHQYQNRLGLFEKYEPPDYSLPKGIISGSKIHSLFLTYVFALDLWLKKDIVVFQQHPLFL